MYFLTHYFKEESFNGQFVKTTKFDSEGKYKIDGNGQYAFEIKDTAGNVHKFNNGNTKIEMYILFGIGSYPK